MRTLTVTQIIPAPIDDVFEAFTDHEKLSEVFGVRSCTLIKQGSAEKNGLGAIRELDCGLLRLREEVTGFDRPHRMEYKIINARPRADHEYGQVDFIEVPDGTKVTWSTRFGNRSPLGGLLDRGFAIAFGIAFRLTLRSAEQRAVAASRAR
ncbi:SRPBCC family protein [Nocardia cerradoensis]|uniref:SRPBCC family protein n=1 Tax=Nocardia cerradoensis TaxID=85688 RepID=UPI000585A696|nr:SRPBCC family protein [Nocardia cerradoensis]NKY42504.1 SRPBCC family protein [Nocardia cerradoensis]